MKVVGAQQPHVWRAQQRFRTQYRFSDNGESEALECRAPQWVHSQTYVSAALGRDVAAVAVTVGLASLNLDITLRRAAGAKRQLQVAGRCATARCFVVVGVVVNARAFCDAWRARHSVTRAHRGAERDTAFHEWVSVDVG